MSFSFYSHTKQKLSFSLQAELTAIGCEAWIDVSRFCPTERSVRQATGTFAQRSLAKSFTNLRKKFRKSSDEARD